MAAYWTAMDTVKDKQALKELYANGAPWELWTRRGGRSSARVADLPGLGRSDPRADEHRMLHIPEGCAHGWRD